MGNKHYFLQRGIVCDDCNNRFSEFESKVLTKSIYGFERARRAIKTKKNKPAESKTNVKIKGDDNFKENFIRIFGLKPEDITGFDPKTGSFQMTVKDFDGSENAMSRFLLKVGIEALFKSRRDVYDGHDFSSAKNYLRNVDNIDWPFTMTKLSLKHEKDIPRFSDKHNLTKIHCRLKYCLYEDSVIFRFSYSNIDSLINLSSRETSWIKEVTKDDPFKTIYPLHIRKKIVE